MKTFVLVHGAWGGSWMWARLAGILRAAGHEVFTPSLTGIGERSHLASPKIDLATHLADVLNVFKYEGLSEAILVGHSYGGMVITGVADQAADRIRALVYLDAFVPKDGEALVDLLSPEGRAAILSGKGWKVPPRAPQMQGMSDPRELAWIEGRRDFQPRKTFTQPLALTGRHLEVPTRVYVFSSGYAPSSFAGFAEQARADTGWRYHELPTHHYPQISMPQETSEILLRYV